MSEPEAENQSETINSGVEINMFRTHVTQKPYIHPSI